MIKLRHFRGLEPGGPGLVNYHTGRIGSKHGWKRKEQQPRKDSVGPTDVTFHGFVSGCRAGNIRHSQPAEAPLNFPQETYLTIVCHYDSQLSLSPVRVDWEMRMTKDIISGNGLQDELEFLLTEVGALANRLRASTQVIHAADHLPLGGKAVLQALARTGPQTVPQIARSRGSSRQNIQVLINRLEAAGMVEFADNPAHRSSVLIHLTATGEKLLAAAMKREAVFLAGLLRHTGESDVLAAGDLLLRLRQLLEGRPVATAPPALKLASEKIRPKRPARRPAVRPPRQKVESKPPPLIEPVEEGLPFHLL